MAFAEGDRVRVLRSHVIGMAGYGQFAIPFGHTGTVVFVMERRGCSAIYDVDLDPIEGVDEHRLRMIAYSESSLEKLA